MSEITELKMAPDLMPSVKNGSKRITIRTGIRDIRLHKTLLIESATNSEDTHTVVPKVIVFSTLGKIPLSFLVEDGFESHQDAVEQMQRFYPDISLFSDVTAVCW